MVYWPEEVRKSMQEQGQEQAKLAESFAKLTDDELEKQRAETDKKLVALKLEFPKWQIQTQSLAYSEIRRLEKERECIILELTKRGLPTHKPKPKLPAPIRPVNTARTVTRAPAPPTETRGSGYIPSDPKPTRMPSRPDDFPGELWPRAVVILSKLIQKFPNQEHLSEFCEHIVVEMTSLYCEAVETGKMKAGSVLNDRSGMEELLRLLLVANDPGHSSWGLSNQAWDILQKVKAATCWGKLAEAIAEAQRDGTGTGHLRTGENQAESSLVQNNGKTTQSAESKSTNAEGQTQVRSIDRGKFCDGVIDEIKRIKNLAVGTGRSVAEIEKENPDFAVWKVRTSLSPEDQETFNHPNQWGPPVGYAKMVLGKIHAVTTHTIDSWVKAYRKDLQAKKA